VMLSAAKQRGEVSDVTWLRPRPAAATESSACRRGNAVGLISFCVGVRPAVAPTMPALPDTLNALVGRSGRLNSRQDGPVCIVSGVPV